MSFLMCLFLVLSLNSCILAPLKAGVDYLKDKALECDEVVDIYYYPGAYLNPEYFRSIEVRCPYTLNPLSQPLPMMYIKRRFYDDYAKKYEDLGMAFPYPRR